MWFRELIEKFKSDQGGNIAAIFSLSVLPIMLSIGAAVDYSLALKMRDKVSNATDAALLAASSSVLQNTDMSDTALIKKKLKAEFEPFFLANIKSEPGFSYRGSEVVYDPKSKSVTATVETVYETMIYKIIGIDTLEEKILSKINMHHKAGGAISMYLVLDRSGSMGWGRPRKMSSLKVAVGSMIGEFKLIDPNEEYVRLGMVSYNSSTGGGPSPNWKLDYTGNRVEQLLAGGGTDSSGAVLRAYQHLKDPLEIEEHQKKNGLDPALIMVFMTDGSNNRSRSDTATINTCNQAKNYGIEIYTVAFMAPAQGERLLNACASSSSHYFEPKNTAELIKAFRKIGAGSAEKLRLSQ